MKKTSVLSQNERRSSSRWSHDLLARLRRSLQEQLDGQGSLPVPREDLVGEVLLRLLATKREEIQSPFAYARTVLRNLIRDKIRELERAQRVLERFARSRPVEVNPGEESDGFDDGELLEYLFKNTVLSPFQERVIRMMYFENMNLTEVARSLGRNPGTIQRHHHRAIEKLARCACRLESPR